MYLVNGKEFTKFRRVHNFEDHNTTIEFYDSKECVEKYTVEELIFPENKAELMQLFSFVQYYDKQYIYAVETNDRVYDIYGGFVVIADSKETVIELLNDRFRNIHISKIKKIGDTGELNSRIVL